MQIRPRLLIAAAATISLLACNNKKESIKSFEISGVITNANAKMIYLEKMPVAAMERIVVDSAPLKADGKYKLSAKESEAMVFNIRLDQNQYPLASVVNDASPITLDAQFSTNNNQFTEKYEVKGSKGSSQLKDFITNFSTELQKIYIISRQADSLQFAKASDTLIKPLIEEHDKIAAGLKNTFYNAVSQFENPALTMFELGYYQSTANNPAFGLEALNNEDVTKLVAGVAAKFPNHQGVAAIKRSLDEQAKKQADKPWVGKMAPDFTLPDVNGKPVSLSSYHGKYVLVDFWASWCQPCRYENPNVVNAYNKYKDKNFAILGVSLDEKKESWLKAIKDDNLTWTHVSDLKGWQSMVVPMYNFGEQGIPYNILLTPDGRVIAERLRGAELDARLAEILK